MTATHFRTSLQSRLESLSDRILLRVRISSHPDGLVQLTGSELLRRSLELAEKHCQVNQSSVVFLLLPHSVELFLLHLGLVLIGRLPAVLPWPTNRVDPEKYQRNLLHQLRNLPAGQMITLPKLAHNLSPGLPFPVTECPIYDYRKLEALFSVDFDASPRERLANTVTPPQAPEDALFLQFSGGTTGDQKCVVVTAPMLVSQLERLSEALQFTREDHVVSWLPLYHDMGLIACFWLPLWNEAASIQFAATDWLLHPGLLFSYLDRYRGTFCWLPNFAFSYLAAQKERVGYDRLNLAHVRGFVNCSEPVRQTSIRSFVEAFQTFGVAWGQCQASYAMAENVFAVTQTTIGDFPETFPRISLLDETSSQKLASYQLLDEYYVSSGRPLPDTSIRIRNSSGTVCGDGIPGGIEIYGPSVFCGYWGIRGFQTQSLASDGWYATGDYGFTRNGALYVIGRTKDIIISGGVNFFPEDIEALVNAVPGIYPGRVVAFGVDDPLQGTESLAIVAEMRGQFDSLAAASLEHEIRHVITSALGAAAKIVRVTPERWIVKSTAGKISRRETRQRFLDENWMRDVSQRSRG